MVCSGCGLQLSLDDNYCRRCGVPANIIDVPAVRGEARSLSAWESAKPAVAQGVLLIAAGAALRFLAGRTGRSLLGRVLFDAAENGPHRLVPFSGERSARRGTDDIEILWYRRVRR
jgi:hypothetical protein